MRKSNITSYLFIAALLSGSMGLSGIALADKHMSDDEMREMMKKRYRDRDDDYMMGRGGMGGGMMGSGMMGGGMMGGGMMGGGMMGGGMMGGGMMGHGGMGSIYMLDLKDEQRDKIDDIMYAMRKQHWELMGKMMDHSRKLQKLYNADTRDAGAIGKVYDDIFRLKRQMIVEAIEADNKAQAVLTKKQHKQLQDLRHGRGMGMMGRGGMGMMGGGMMY